MNRLSVMHLLHSMAAMKLTRPVRSRGCTNSGRDITRRSVLQLSVLKATCLRQHTGQFLKDKLWIEFTKRAAILREATGRPPLYREEEESEQDDSNNPKMLDSEDTKQLNLFCKIEPLKSVLLPIPFGRPRSLLSYSAMASRLFKKSMAFGDYLHWQHNISV